MRPAAGGALSGCVVWGFVFLLLLGCLVPAAMMIGGVSSTLGGEAVARRMSPLLCPEGSSGEIITYQTITTDEFGNPGPSTAYEMQCVDDSGSVTREPSPDYAFIWLGILGALALLTAGLLSLLLAAPVGVLIGRVLRRREAKS